MNKRLLAGVAAAGIIGGGVYGFAAGLSPVSDTLGAGADDVSSCDSSIDASYAVSYVAGSGYKVASVDLSGIDAGCDDEAFRITLSNAANASLVELTGVIDQTTGSQSVTVPVDTTVLASAVEGIDVVVSGDNP